MTLNLADINPSIIPQLPVVSSIALTPEGGVPTSVTLISKAVSPSEDFKQESLLSRISIVVSSWLISTPLSVTSHTAISGGWLLGRDVGLYSNSSVLSVVVITREEGSPLK